ncbi:MAG: DUF2085 domain-containing protein [Candidatus Thermoplasmatota archaeon]|nr:DUF2085 domain-containing protein [Candidatus Thermoplasmatota archaeon]
MEKRKHPLKSIVFLFFLLFFIWVLLQFLAPLALPSGSVSDLSGVVGSSENDAIFKDLSFPWNVVYSVGDRLCHQRSERSLYLNGNEMPFCARCTAIWLGLTIGLGFMVFYTIELTEKYVFAIILALVPIGVDGIGQLFGFWESTNVVRILTGLPAGIICGVALGIIYDEVRSFQFFNKTKTT